MNFHEPFATLEVALPEPPRCRRAPSPRLSARCELSEGHEHQHIGRTRGGYWKIWPKEGR